MARVEKRAYAKINLYLEVMARRDDGFHELSTVMRQVELFDTVCVSTTPDGAGKTSLTVRGDDALTSGEGNIAYRAAEKYRTRAGISDSVEIILDKRIPVGAGLGGGSADCAAVLSALNEIYGALGREELFCLAGELGSDVPFCLFGKSAVCEGRGEIITPIDDVVEMHLVIAKMARAVSTPDAFSRLDRARGEGKQESPCCEEKHLKPLLKYLSGEGEIPPLYNAFETALGEVEPDVLSLKEKMLSAGALATLMSGSGPSVFGIFPDEESAVRLIGSLKSNGICAYYSK